jgi:hypothetical protein
MTGILTLDAVQKPIHPGQQVAIIHKTFIDVDHTFRFKHIAQQDGVLKRLNADYR